MKISKELEDALNLQVKREFDSAFLYLDMSNALASMDYDGMANWMFVQYREELQHAQKMLEYVKYRDGDVKIGAIEKIKTPESKTPLDFFKEAYNQECKVTSFINAIFKQAREEGDYATESFLKWYIDEQVEEEDSALKMIKDLEPIVDDKKRIHCFDKKIQRKEEELLSE